MHLAGRAASLMVENHFDLSSLEHCAGEMVVSRKRRKGGVCGVLVVTSVERFLSYAHNEEISLLRRQLGSRMAMAGSSKTGLNSLFKNVPFCGTTVELQQTESVELSCSQCLHQDE